MTDIVFRDDDFLRWGAGLGANLAAADFDNNNWWFYSHILALEEHPHEGVGIEDIQVHGDQMTIHLSNGMVEGPFTLPTALPVWRGTWAPSTIYYVNDGFTENNAVYVVLKDHVSGTTFDANATDGSGHNLYGLQIEVEGALPTGGAVGQVLFKTTTHEFDTSWEFMNVETLNNVSFTGLSTGDLLYWNGVDWSNLHSSTLTTELSHLTDVALTSPLTTNQVLTWNGTHWANAWPFVAMEDLQDFFLTSPLNTGDVVTWDGAEWTNQTITVPTDITDLGDVFIQSPNNANDFFYYNGGNWSNFPAGTPGALAPTTGSITLSPATAKVFTLTPTGDCTISCNDISCGYDFYIVVTTTGTTSRTLTFAGGSFKTTGTLATGTVSGKKFVMHFITDGNFANEASRTTAM